MGPISLTSFGLCEIPGGHRKNDTSRTKSPGPETPGKQPGRFLKIGSKISWKK